MPPFYFSRGATVIVRLKLAIEQEEYSALMQLATAELRNPESNCISYCAKNYSNAVF